MSAVAVTRDNAGVPPPVRPREPAELGLPEVFLFDFVLKHLLRARNATVADLSRRTALAPTLLEPLLLALRDQRCVEVTGRGVADAQIAFTLTDDGRRRAADAQAISQYCGPAPVTLEQYRGPDCRAVPRSGAGGCRPDPLGAGGPGSGGGPAGASRFGAEFRAGGLPVRSQRQRQDIPGGTDASRAWRFDQGAACDLRGGSDHHRLRPGRPSPREQGSRRRSVGLDRADRADARWVEVERPVVVAGWRTDARGAGAGIRPRRPHPFCAPPQLKANGGLLIVDDLGRQRISPRELMNRWIVPLDRRVDYLSLATGVRLGMPFDVRVVFSSNLAPEELADPAFVRRIGYKIHVGEMKESSYRAVVRAACVRRGVSIDDTMVDYLDSPPACA